MPTDQHASGLGEQCPHCGANVLFVGTICPSCQIDRDNPNPHQLKRLRVRLEPANRPVSVTVVSWLLIIWSVAGFGLPLVAAVLHPKYMNQDVATRLMLIGVAEAGKLVIGIGLLWGLQWARTLFLSLFPIVVALNFFRESEIGLVLTIVYLIYLVVLTRRRARLFFSETAA